jgi:modulator of FtsH protease
VDAYTTGDWQNLFVAVAGASAALAGLLFVAVSINLDRILALGLPSRAIGAITMLISVLFVAIFGLVPGQPRGVLAAELLAVGVASWTILAVIKLRRLRGDDGQPTYARYLSVVLSQAASLPFVVAGASLIPRAGGGLYWLVPGIVFALLEAVLDAWVLLVEILR